MKTATLIALVAIAAGLPTIAHAQGKDKKAAAPSCPACKMTLSAKKSDKTPVGVAIGKKVFYCCAGCDMKSWAKDKKGNVIPPAAKP